MDHHTIDPSLALALEDVRDPDERAFVVFIHTDRPLGPAEAALLERHGVQVGARQGPIFTATISRHAVEELSDQPWVRSLKLSAKRRPLQPH